MQGSEAGGTTPSGLDHGGEEGKGSSGDQERGKCGVFCVVVAVKL